MISVFEDYNDDNLIRLWQNRRKNKRKAAKWGGSRPGRQHIARERAEGARRIWDDYLKPGAKYQDLYSPRRYRISERLYLNINRGFTRGIRCLFAKATPRKE